MQMTWRTPWTFIPVKVELHILRSMLNNESTLTDEARTILIDFPVAS